MSNATFVRSDLSTFTRLDGLGLEAVGQRLEPGRAVLECRVVEPDPWCRRCGGAGVPRGTVARRLAHEPFGWRPTTLLVRVRRYRCPDCAHVWRQGTTAAAEPKAKLSRRALRWALEAIVVQHLTMARVAEGLGVAWNTANDAVLAEGRRVLIADPARFDGVTAIGVAEHVVRHEALLFSDGGERPASLGRRSGRVKLAAVRPRGTPGVDGSSRDKVRAVRHYRTGRAW